jgi:uncharacterized protein YgiM (DUF1202 family)
MLARLFRVALGGALLFSLAWSLAPRLASAADFDPTDVVVVNTDFLNLRSDAGTDGTIRQTLRNGARMMITDGPRDDDGYTWYKVSLLGDSDETPITGWVAADFIDLEADVSDFESAGWVEVVDGPVNLRDEPGFEGAVLDTLSTGETADILTESDLEGADGYTWINVSQDNGETGWLATDFLGALNADPGTTDPGDDDDATGFEDAEGVEVVDGPVNVREEPSLSAAVSSVQATGSKFFIISGSTIEEADGYTWVNIKNFGGVEGWMATAFLSPVTDMPCGDGACYPEELDPFYGVDAAIVTDGPVNLRAEPTTSADVLTLLEDGDYLWFTDAVVNMVTEADGYVWLEVSVAGDTGWVAIDFISPAE